MAAANPGEARGIRHSHFDGVGAREEAFCVFSGMGVAVETVRADRLEPLSFHPARTAPPALVVAGGADDDACDQVADDRRLRVQALWLDEARAGRIDVRAVLADG